MLHVSLHDFEFCIVQFAGFEQNLITNAELADVMQQGALDQALYLWD